MSAPKHGQSYFNSRRKFLIGSLILAFVPLPFLLHSLDEDAKKGSNTFGEHGAGGMKSADFVDQYPQVCRIGEIYLQLHPTENSADQLSKLLFDEDFPKILSSSSPISTNLAREKVRKKMIVNFEQSETLCIQGWILSRTECRLFALFSHLENGCPKSDGWIRELSSFIADTRFRIRRKSKILLKNLSKRFGIN